MSSGKQPAGLKLTSGSGEQAFYEEPLLANRRWQNLYLIDTMGNYIMGISKPIDLIVKVRLGGLWGAFPPLCPSLIYLNDISFRGNY
jgi:hypothetical protein